MVIKLVWLIWAFVKSAFLKIGYEYAKDILKLATEYVVEVGTRTDLTNAEKREWVANKLRNHAIESGNPVADSILNLFIEIALQRVKAEAN